MYTRDLPDMYALVPMLQLTHVLLSKNQALCEYCIYNKNTLGAKKWRSQEKTATKTTDIRMWPRFVILYCNALWNILRPL